MKAIDLVKGESIKNFTIIDYLGSGMEGSCYSCLDERDKKKKTIKFFPVSEKQTLLNIYSIKDAYLRLSKFQGIVKFFESGRIKFKNVKYVYFLLEYIDGTTIHALYENKRKENRWNIESAIKIIYELTVILYPIHAKQLAVNDFSNGKNIILRFSDGNPVFIDISAGEFGFQNHAIVNDIIDLRILARTLLEDTGKSKIRTLFDEILSQHNSNVTSETVKFIKEDLFNNFKEIIAKTSIKSLLSENSHTTT